MNCITYLGPGLFAEEDLDENLNEIFQQVMAIAYGLAEAPER